MITIHDPAVGGADGVGKISLGVVGVVFGKDLVDVASLVFTRFGDFPFIPNFDAAFLKPADVV